MDESSLAAEQGEYLDPGYDPQTPDGDNLLLDFVRAEAELWTSWGESMGATIGRDEASGAVWVDSGSPSVLMNPVIWARPMDAAAQARVTDRVHATFAERAGGPYLLYSAYPTDDLTGAGFSAVGHPPCMVRMPTLTASDARLPAAAELELRRVTDLAGLDDFERVMVEAYPMPEVLPWRRGVMMGSSLIEHPRWHIFVGYVAGEAVATSAAFVTDHGVDVTLVSTRPEFRGRGIGRAITAAAADVDTAKPAMLLASDDGQPVYRAMGFVSMTRYTLWIGHRTT